MSDRRSAASTHDRASSESMERLTVRLPAADKAAIEARVAAGVEPNQSAFVRTAIAQYLAATDQTIHGSEPW